MSTVLLPAFDDVAGECVGTNEVAQLHAVGLQNRMPVSLPQQRALADEADLVSDFKA